MGRMTKQGIDYFSLDCQFEDKVELFLLVKEAVGLAVFITLLQLIYQNEGYYISNGKDLFLLIKKRISVGISEIDSCINAMLERDIFNKKLHKKYGILTSSGIQKRYFDAAKRKKAVRVIRNYIVIGIDVYENLKNVDINEIDSQKININAIKVKEEERKKKRKEELLAHFENFWTAYPKKKNKGKAREAFFKLNPDKQLLVTIIAKIEQAKKSEDWQKEGGKYIPYPTSWLNGEGWEDEIKENNYEHRTARSKQPTDRETENIGSDGEPYPIDAEF